MPIYTRTGDKGKTSLFDGTRVFKSDARVDAYGTVDELNSSLGVVRAFLSLTKHKAIYIELEKIQHDLFEIGAALANPYAMPANGLESRPGAFEKFIDTFSAQVPEFKEFILPSGGKPGALLHVSRTIARRAERRIVHLAQTEDIDESVIIYINRLSDLLYMMARYVNFLDRKQETKWKKK
jgi:cob(I)alamin adenosyltransferase